MVSVVLSMFMIRHASQQMDLVLCMRSNAVMDIDRPTLRALLWRPTTALQYLTRAKAIACPNRKTRVPYCETPQLR